MFDKRLDQLLVEGPNDGAVLNQLLARHGIDLREKTQQIVEAAGGFEACLDKLEIQVANRRFRRLGAVLDLDREQDRRWEHVRTRLRATGLPNVPNELPLEGCILQGLDEGSRVGVWFMPDNRTHGALEAFLETLIPDEDAVWPFARTSSAEAKRLGAPYREVDTAKARLLTWLAWQDEPGKQYGQAVNARILGHDSSTALAFVDWFRRLFVA